MSKDNWWERDKSKDKPAPKKIKPKSRTWTNSPPSATRMPPTPRPKPRHSRAASPDLSVELEVAHDEDQRTIEEIAARATNFKGDVPPALHANVVSGGISRATVDGYLDQKAKDKLVMAPGVEVVGTKKMSKANLELVSRDDVGVVSDVFGKFSMAVRYPDPVGRLFGFREEWRIKP